MDLLNEFHRRTNKISDSSAVRGWGWPTEMNGERRGGETMAEQPQRRGASNIDTFDGQWSHLRGQVRSWWGQLTDADVDKIAGEKDVLVGLLQERYGYARERAEQEVERHVHEYRDQREASGVRQMGETVTPPRTMWPHT